MKHTRDLMSVCIFAGISFVTHSVMLYAHFFFEQVNFVSFSPYSEWVLATASSDTDIGLFDLRKLEVPLHFLSSHTYDPHLSWIHVVCFSLYYYLVVDGLTEYFLTFRFNFVCDN